MPGCLWPSGRVRRGGQPVAPRSKVSIISAARNFAPGVTFRSVDASPRFPGSAPEAGRRRKHAPCSRPALETRRWRGADGPTHARFASGGFQQAAQHLEGGGPRHHVGAETEPKISPFCTSKLTLSVAVSPKRLVSFGTTTAMSKPAQRRQTLGQRRRAAGSRLSRSVKASSKRAGTCASRTCA